MGNNCHTSKEEIKQFILDTLGDEGINYINSTKCDSVYSILHDGLGRYLRNAITDKFPTLVDECGCYAVYEDLVTEIFIEIRNEILNKQL